MVQRLFIAPLSSEDVSQHFVGRTGTVLQENRLANPASIAQVATTVRETRLLESSADFVVLPLDILLDPGLSRYLRLRDLCRRTPWIHGLPARRRRHAHRASLQVAKAQIVGGSPGLVPQRLIRFGEFQELLMGLPLTRISVGMVLEGEFAVPPANVLRRRRPGKPEGIVMGGRCGHRKPGCLTVGGIEKSSVHAAEEADHLDSHHDSNQEKNADTKCYH